MQNMKVDSIPNKNQVKNTIIFSIVVIAYFTNKELPNFTIIIYFSTFTIRQRSNSLFVGPLAGFFKCLTLFCFDFSMTLTGHLSSLSVCHTKNIISLNTSIHTTVSWNWLSQDLYRFILRGNIYAIECTCGTIHVLWDLSDSPRLS